MVLGQRLLVLSLVLALASCTASHGSDPPSSAVSADPPQQSTDTFFVSALHGNDTATGSSRATAFRTLARCAAVMVAPPAPATCEVGVNT